MRIAPTRSCVILPSNLNRQLQTGCLASPSFGSSAETGKVLLRNGAKANLMIVQKTHRALHQLLTSGRETDLVALADLMEWARGAVELPGHESIPILPSELIDPRSFPLLEKKELIPADHLVSMDVLNTVLSATAGCYPNVAVLSPYPSKSSSGKDPASSEHPVARVLKALLQRRWPF